MDGLIDNEDDLGGEIWVCLGYLIIDQVVGGEMVRHVQDGGGNLCCFPPNHAADLVEVSEHIESFVGGVGPSHFCRRQLLRFDVG